MIPFRLIQQTLMQQVLIKVKTLCLTSLSWWFSWAVHRSLKLQVWNSWWSSRHTWFPRPLVNDAHPPQPNATSPPGATVPNPPQLTAPITPQTNTVNSLGATAPDFFQLMKHPQLMTPTSTPQTSVLTNPSSTAVPNFNQVSVATIVKFSRSLSDCQDSIWSKIDPLTLLQLHSNHPLRLWHYANQNPELWVPPQALQCITIALQTPNDLGKPRSRFCLHLSSSFCFGPLELRIHFHVFVSVFTFPFSIY